MFSNLIITDVCHSTSIADHDFESIGQKMVISPPNVLQIDTQ